MHRGRAGDVAYSLGTSGGVLTTALDPVHDPTGLVNGVADAAGGYLPLACTLNCTKVTDLMSRLLGVDVVGLTRLALDASPRADRPVLAAYLDGERTPDLPDATGLLADLTGDTTREDLALAAFEGVLLGMRRGHLAIQAAGAPADGTALVLGGGARSEAYRQILADLLEKPVVVRDAPEATARGACLQAAAVLHAADITAVRDAWRPTDVLVTEPRRSRNDVWQRFPTGANSTTRHPPPRRHRSRACPPHSDSKDWPCASTSTPPTATPSGHSWRPACSAGSPPTH
ncbi:hypothetical protein GCM10023215_45990 [Pseudonocardia yuanmonensis]|uniref:Carbohydrate kinase FGGY C-terminal domain-containing protein n=1 Tax=Pseudonocardia yuanmonensis TaxID=1095914 RepID=A0ABP8X6K6_9PSEU